MAYPWQVERGAALLVSLVLVTLAAGSPVLAESLVFQQGAGGYAGAVDTFLKGSAADTPQGSAAVIEWDGDDGGGVNYGLLRFEGLFGSGPGQIPPGATIQSAILTCDIINIGHAGNVNEVLVPWTASTTYNNFGGDAGVQPDEYGALVGTANGGVLGGMDLNVTASLVGWQANPTGNRGWIFRPTGTDGVQIRSSESTDAARRPKLTVTFSPPVTGVRLTPDFIRTMAGQADLPVVLAIAPGSNAVHPVQVTLTSDNPAVAAPVGGAGGVLTVLFAAGGPDQQTIHVDIGSAGRATIATTNDAGLEDDDLSVQVFAYEWITLVDPYADVDWGTFVQHKANLHTHTTQSDGSLSPSQAIDEYHQRDYTILALTDHNRCTWPWQNWGRDPGLLGMVATAGNETSQHHHMNSFFIQYETTSSNLEQTLTEVGAAGGLAVLNHPGRYTYTVQDYVGWFTTYDHLIGLEVINQGGRYNGNWSPVWPGNDLHLWDQVLAILMPDRPVWGLACDDMHTLSHLGRDWNTLLLAGLTEGHAREALERGQFYFSSVATAPTASRSVAQTPVIEAIVRDAAGGTITVFASSGDQPLPEANYRWISAGVVIHVGPTLDYFNTPGIDTYVRAEMAGQGGSSFTNPFGVVIEVPTLWRSPDRLERSVHWRENLTAGSFAVANTGPGTLNYSVTVDADWLLVEPDSGTCGSEPVMIGISYDVADLPIGVHEATITVSSPEAFNGSQTLAVSVDVRSVGPDLDRDGDVDLDDFARLQACLTGAGMAQNGPACAGARLGEDGDVDVHDLSRLRLCFSGAEIPADPACDD